ncbi:hypothetical protein DYB36_008683 [Aphanomyces astaci]|uniref:Uncharacterized protein n=1 Tax=Aphanomyces astaci TaxID=112090 RepID=A0A396ZY41_APHAT|nr:hypothetical protein DYB36_008683 [Aphanomyces astaci]
MPATLCVLVLTVPYLTSMPLTHKRRESAIMASPRRNQSNLLVMTAMIAMGLVPTMALVANIDADNDPLVVLEMEGGTTSMTTPVTIIATANAVKATAALILEVRLPLYPPRPLFQNPANLTKMGISLFPTSAFSAIRSDIHTAASETPLKVVLQRPPKYVDGVRPHPAFQVVVGIRRFRLHADLRYCESNPSDAPLPMLVTYRPNDFPALREHWIVDSGASASSNTPSSVSMSVAQDKLCLHECRPGYAWFAYSYCSNRLPNQSRG